MFQDWTHKDIPAISCIIVWLLPILVIPVCEACGLKDDQPVISHTDMAPVTYSADEMNDLVREDAVTMYGCPNTECTERVPVGVVNFPTVDAKLLLQALQPPNRRPPTLLSACQGTICHDRWLIEDVLAPLTPTDVDKPPIVPLRGMPPAGAIFGFSDRVYTFPNLSPPASAGNPRDNWPSFQQKEGHSLSN